MARQWRNPELELDLAVFAIERNEPSIELNDIALLDAGALRLVDAIRENPLHITRLSLQNTQIGAKGGKAIADLLRDAPNLRTVILDGNLIGDEGAAAFARALSHLTHLDLKSNGIGEAGTLALVGALRTNRTLRRLELGGSDNLVAYSPLAKWLRDNTTLDVLDFGGGPAYNFVSAQIFLEFVDALRFNRNLSVFRASIEWGGGRITEALDNMMEENGWLTELSPSSKRADDLLLRNIEAHARVRRAIRELWLVMRRTPGIRPLWRRVAQQLWASRGESVWWGEERGKRRCVQCVVRDALLVEEKTPLHAFCGAECQRAFYVNGRSIDVPDENETPEDRYQRKWEELFVWHLPWFIVFLGMGREPPSGIDPRRFPAALDPLDHALWLEYWNFPLEEEEEEMSGEEMSISQEEEEEEEEEERRFEPDDDDFPPTQIVPSQ